jgi:hypothetical protein
LNVFSSIHFEIRVEIRNFSLNHFVFSWAQHFVIMLGVGVVGIDLLCISNLFAWPSYFGLKLLMMGFGLLFLQIYRHQTLVSDLFSLQVSSALKSSNFIPSLHKNGEEQAGAELCQAQVKLGLAKLAVTRKKVMACKLEVTFLLKRD